MASMSSIQASMEGSRDQELPPSVGVDPSGSRINGVHYYRPRPPVESGYQSYPSTEDDGDNDPEFPTDPEELHDLMTNLGLIVNAMRKMGAFEEEDDMDSGLYGDANMDSVVPEGASTSTSTSTSSSGPKEVVDLRILLDYTSQGAPVRTITIPDKNKKIVRFQNSVVANLEEDQFVPEFDENGNVAEEPMMMDGDGDGGQIQGQPGQGQALI